MFKKIFINGEETTYRIYDNGQVMNKKTGHYYKGTIRNGYRWFDLRWKDKKYQRSQHRLMAEAFIPNPNNLEYVHHLNNDRLDNRIENLQWVTAAENNLAENKSQPTKDYRDYQEYDEALEEWRTYKDTIYMVSNFGRVKNSVRGTFLQGKVTNAGYREYCLRIDGKKKSIRGHILVWDVWVGTERMVINHINGNKLDNRLTNLENVTNQENVLKAIYETKTLRFKRTACYDKEGNLVQIFMNNADAARHMGVRPQSIQQAIAKGWCSCGYFWKNLEE